MFCRIRQLMFTHAKGTNHCTLYINIYPNFVLNNIPIITEVSKFCSLLYIPVLNNPSVEEVLLMTTKFTSWIQNIISSSGHSKHLTTIVRYT